MLKCVCESQTTVSKFVCWVESNALLTQEIQIEIPGRCHRIDLVGKCAGLAGKQAMLRF